MTVTKPINPREWRELLRSVAGSTWTFGTDNAPKPDGRANSVIAYSSMPMTSNEAENAAATLAKCGIEARTVGSLTSDKVVLKVAAAQLETAGDKMVTAANTQQQR